MPNEPKPECIIKERLRDPSSLFGIIYYLAQSCVALTGFRDVKPNSINQSVNHSNNQPKFPKCPLVTGRLRKIYSCSRSAISPASHMKFLSLELTKYGPRPSFSAILPFAAVNIQVFFTKACIFNTAVPFIPPQASW